MADCVFCYKDAGDDLNHRQCTEEYDWRVWEGLCVACGQRDFVHHDTHWCRECEDGERDPHDGRPRYVGYPGGA